MMGDVVLLSYFSSIKLGHTKKKMERNVSENFEEVPKHIDLH